MRAHKLISVIFSFAIFFGITTTAGADLYKVSDFGALTGGASYGPPTAVGFPDGPTSVGSGENVNLTYGPGPGQADVNALLFVLSLYDPSSLDSGTISFSLVGDSSSPVNFDSGDFISTGAAGFPANIGGIANGEVGGVKFPDAQHAGVLYSVFTGHDEGDPFGTVIITSPIFPLRVDIFGIDDGKIINNTPNSHALAVVPEPASMLLLGSGLIGFAVVGRKKFFKKK